ncbi:MAG TPA: hypothetical protein VIJ59_03655, partial [Caulobacteraceae bacterium]
MKTCLGLALAAVGVLGAGAATAGNFGSAIFSTYRSCAAVTATTICDGSGPGQRVLFPAGSEFGPPGGPFGPSVLTGGDMLSSTGSFTVAAGSSDSSITFLTANSLPVMSGDVSAPGDVRTGSNGVSYYTYTNTGGVGVNLVLSASIAFNSSSASPSGTGGASLPGGAEYEASVAIVDPSYLADQLSGPDSAAFGLGYTAADAFAYDLELGVTAAACGTAGVDALGTATATTTGGSGGTSVSSSACSGGGGFVVAPGQSVIILDWYHLDANRGGEVD